MLLIILSHSGILGLCGIEYKEDLEDRKEEIKDFCELIKNS